VATWSKNISPTGITEDVITDLSKVSGLLGESRAIQAFA